LKTTMKHIAMRAGVSAATVSRVLNDKATAISVSRKTREKVQALAREMGYRPNLFAKSLRTNRSFLVGVVAWDLSDPFNGEVLRGIEQVLDEEDYSLLLNTAEASRQRMLRCLEKMSNVRADGVILMGGPETWGEKEIVGLGVDPQTLVLMGIRAQGLDASSVIVDNVLGGFLGAEYLIKLGRRSIIYVAGKEKELDMEDRLLGVRKAIGQYGAENRFSIIDAGPGENEGYTVTQEILSKTQSPMAIFGLNDMTALGIIRAVKDSGLRVPQDVAVLGFDDLSMASYLEPRLSTVHQPRLELGISAAELVVRLIDNKCKGAAKVQFHKVLNPSLVIREST